MRSESTQICSGTVCHWNVRRFLAIASGLAACLSGLVPARADDWPQWLGPQRDAVWRETGIIEIAVIAQTSNDFVDVGFRGAAALH